MKGVEKERERESVCVSGSVRNLEERVREDEERESLWEFKKKEDLDSLVYILSVLLSHSPLASA